MLEVRNGVREHGRNDSTERARAAHHARTSSHAQSTCGVWRPLALRLARATTASCRPHADTSQSRPHTAYIPPVYARPTSRAIRRGRTEASDADK